MRGKDDQRQALSRPITAAAVAAGRGKVARGERWLGLLVLPALIFVLLVFLLPIARFLWLSVDNSDLTQGLARTLAALGEETAPAELPSETVFAALAADLAEARALRRDGKIAQALNQRLVGTRLLVIRSAQEAGRGSFAPPYAKDILKKFPGWAEPKIWQVLRRDAGALTDFHLLASLDLRRGADGAIMPLPEDQAQFRRVLLRTVWISAVVTLISALLALPVAAAITSAPPRLGRILLLLVLFPLWSSLLVRTVIWIITLQRNGPVNGALLQLGLIDQPLTLIYTRLSLYLAMVQVLLPLSVLSLVAVERRVPKTYMQAALSLGAPWFYAWRSVHLPMILPGILAGSGLVFVFALGYYVTPLLVGGPGEQMISSLIALYTDDTLNWGLAAALSVQVMLLVLAAGFGVLLLSGLVRNGLGRRALSAAFFDPAAARGFDAEDKGKDSFPSATPSARGEVPSRAQRLPAAEEAPR